MKTFIADLFRFIAELMEAFSPIFPIAFMAFFTYGVGVMIVKWKAQRDYIASCRRIEAHAKKYPEDFKTIELD